MPCGLLAFHPSKDSMECICVSKDTGKTTSPAGHWEVQNFTHRKDWLISPICRVVGGYL